jgi:hypothetical protein
MPIACKTATFSTGEEGASNLATSSGTLEVHPIYGECELQLGGIFTTNVITTGCNYLLHASRPGAAMDITCKEGREILLEPEADVYCTISIPPQSGLTGVQYRNEAGKVKLKIELSSIRWKAPAGCYGAHEGANGVYR